MKYKAFLFFIVLFFFVSRFFRITEIPPSLYWDEASIGYNAYSILKTGRDEWGEFLPLHFRAFGEFKLPVYIYAVALTELIFGVNEFSVRLPAVLFSLIGILFTYLVARRIFDEKVALFSSFFMTITPWFFLISRTGYEVTSGIAFFMAGLYFSLKEGSFKNIIYSIILFILSIYSYNSYRIITPALILFILLLRIRNIRLNYLFFIFGVFLLSWIPILRLYKFDYGLIRFTNVGVKSLSEFFVNYLSYFRFDFLFQNGDSNLRSHIGKFGELFIIQLPFILTGLFVILRERKLVKTLPIIILLISLVPSALTKESPHSLRALNVIPFISILSAVGVVNIAAKIKLKFLAESIVILGSIIFFIHYFYLFLSFFPKVSSKDWQYGYKQIYTKFNKDFDNFDTIYISNQFGQPYIFALFYLKIGPIKFRQERILEPVDKWGFSTVSRLGKFHFISNRDTIFENSKSLLFLTNESIPNGARKVEEIRFLNGNKAFDVYQL